MRGPTVSDAMETYLSTRVAQGELSRASAKKIAVGLRDLLDAVGDKPVRKLDRHDANAWLSHTNAKGLAASTRRLRWSYINVFCEWCVDEEMLERNPFRKVKPPKPPRKTAVTLSAEEVARVLAVVPTVRDRLIVLLMVQTGLRCAGVSTLMVEHVDFDRREFWVREKFGHERVLPIPEECWETLCDYLRLWPAERGPLIRAWSPNTARAGGRARASERPIGPATISKFLADWMYEAGVKQRARDGKSAHAFRRTCASDMVDQGADIVEVRDTLGHASIATTNDYLGAASPKRLRSAVEGRRYQRPVA